MVTVLTAAVRADGVHPPGMVFEVAVPGGIQAALSAIDDRAAPDRSQFLLELIRRFERPPLTRADDSQLPARTSLQAHLDRWSIQNDAPGAVRETVPLPLSPETWIDVVFGGRATAQTLVADILRSRSASLLYTALLSLDDDTREWLAGRPDLVAHLASRQPAAFLVAAPGLRVRGGRMALPGGEAADPVWLALVGRSVHEPAEFIRRIVELRQGRLAYFLSAMAQLPSPRIDLALKLESPDPSARVAAARRLYAVFEHLASRWRIDRQPFWRPALDPALLLNEVRMDERGRPMLPASGRFWRAVFAGAPRTGGDPTADDGPNRAADSVEFAGLCERVFADWSVGNRRPYGMVLFASRHHERITPTGERDAVEAVRAAGRYPALVAALERAGLEDLSAYAAAARRAARLNAIGDQARAIRAIAQFQGALALVARAKARGSLSANALPSLVSSLAAVDVSERGDYEGRLVRWLDTQLVSPFRLASSPEAADEATAGGVGEMLAGPMERDLLRLLAGSFAVEPRFVDWEGTRYRVDLSRAEAMRLARVLGNGSRPYVTAARALIAISDPLANSSADAARWRAAADAFADLEAALGEERGYREIAHRLERAVRDSDFRGAAQIVGALRMLADDLLARGLMELAYAVAFGQPDVVAISAGEAAIRHDFEVGPSLASEDGRAWQLPEASAGEDRGWHVTGSVLGLDVRLARFSLVRTSSRLPPRRPMLDEAERRVFTEAVGLIEPASLSETRRASILAALRRGRERLAALRTPSEAGAFADEIRLSPARRTLLTWAVAHEPDRVSASLSLSELLWLGLERTPADATFDAWGAPGEPRLGCLCLRFIDRRPWEILAGRWNSGIFASGFPDLNLRLSELLADLGMPAALLGAVLAAATVDFTENANSRDPDDRRGILEFVHALKRERVEEYLALLTTDGPLVPVGDAAAAATQAREPR